MLATQDDAITMGIRSLLNLNNLPSKLNKTPEKVFHSISLIIFFTYQNIMRAKTLELPEILRPSIL